MLKRVIGWIIESINTCSKVWQRRELFSSSIENLNKTFLTYTYLDFTHAQSSLCDDRLNVDMKKDCFIAKILSFYLGSLAFLSHANFVFFQFLNSHIWHIHFNFQINDKWRQRSHTRLQDHHSNSSYRRQVAKIGYYLQHLRLQLQVIHQIQCKMAWEFDF